MNSTKARQIARLLRLIPLLLLGNRSREALIADLADDLAAEGLADALPAAQRGVDATSTMNRDLRLIRDLGLLQALHGHGYHHEPGPRLPLWVSPSEAHALEAARHALVQLGMPDTHLLDTLLARVGGRIRHGTPRWSLAPSLRGIQPEVWQAIQSGLARGRRMRITYRYPDRPAGQRVLDGARLVWMTGAFYLCAVRPDLMGASPPTFVHVREYRVDRIVDVDVLDTAIACATLPTLEVVFRLTHDLIDRVHDMVDGDGRQVQRVEQLDDGTLRVTVQEISELRARQRILAFGEHLVAVEAPDMLRRKLRKEAESLERCLRG